MLTAESRIDLPPVPQSQCGNAVAAWREPLVIDSYLPEPPDRFPAYLEKRVYQGSSGQVYPMPFFERISSTKRPHEWDAIHIENEWVRLVILPELGGRIHIAYDKANDYDFFYRNNVIKPALVGLLGPWISGGVEFNWPQHHRPATMLPTDSFIEFEPDGAATVWCSDHDPFNRMKGMHGIRLRPDSAVVEARVRLFNRTEDTQTFLWWANVAARVDDNYQSFFPTDVRVVADHAKRAMSEFPRARGTYYGIDYPARLSPETPDADRLDWYRNIPVPTSYMCLGSEDDFFGGYDHGRAGGFVHWADHRISPGKKQWTWGNSPFGWAWDANLTDGDGPYVELMAGVYTDNQPDFSYLSPGETKTFSQYWFPISGIGTVQQANLDVAVHCEELEPSSPSRPGLSLDVGVATTKVRAGARVSVLGSDGAVLWHAEPDLAPGKSLRETVLLPAGTATHKLTLLVEHEGEELLRWTPRQSGGAVDLPEPAREPLAPEQIASSDELFLTGVHLEQFRHATRSPEPYWVEALRRDEGDVRANTALAARFYRAGRYLEALELLEAAITRITALNPNPYDGEPHYRLGLTLRRLDRLDKAVDAFAKAAWNSAWRGPAWLAMAQIAAAAGDDAGALKLVDQVLALDSDNTRAGGIRVTVLRRLGRVEEADAQVRDILLLDPLDKWSRDLAGRTLEPDPQSLVDVALEYRAIGDLAAALRLLDSARSVPRAAGNAGQNNAAPLIEYYRAEILGALGRDMEADSARRAAREVDATNALPGRLDDAGVLERTLALEPDDARARALLGHWLYSQRRYREAIGAWREAVRLHPGDVVSWRNLGIAEFNVNGDVEEARRSYEAALEAAPDNAKLWYEADQLAKRMAVPPAERLGRLRSRPELIAQRDDLTTEYAMLLVIAGNEEDRAQALHLLGSRQFQPWEGGEGLVLAAWDAANLTIARHCLRADAPRDALDRLNEALNPPASLGEGRHDLANCSDLWLALGDGYAAEGRREQAEQAWTRAATATGDFQRMAPLAYSERTYYSVLAWRRLGKQKEAQELAVGLARHAESLAGAVPEIDYFATSLPTMLLFIEDLAERQETTRLLLLAQLDALEGDFERSRELLSRVLERDPSVALAVDLANNLTKAAAL
jgi:tetratricopeptide (TPR) repeat protein